MPYEVKLPDVGEGIAEGEIVRWLVKPGDRVKPDQPLVEVMTDKASVEIPSPRAGTVSEIHAEAGDVVRVGSVIITIALPGEPAPPPGEPPSPAAANEDMSRWTAEGGALSTGPAIGTSVPESHGSPETRASSESVSPRSGSLLGVASPAPPASSPGRVQATPMVRQLARELGVVLAGLKGSGPGGAITTQDVRRAAERKPASAPAGGVPDRDISTGTTTGARAIRPVSDERESRVPLRGLRRKIAEHMRRSIETAAHYTFVAECDMTAVVEHRGSLRNRAERAGVRLTFLAYVLKALIEPLRQYPVLNASLDDEASEVVLKRYYHIGVATHTEEGLTVPVIPDVDRLSLFGIAREIERLAMAAREGRIKLEELQGGTFTVTSTGARGGVLATPILNHPQVAILGVHEIKQRPAVVEGAIVARDLTNLSLSLDHRVVDGAVGADFLYALIDRLEHPSAWIGEQDFV